METVKEVYDILDMWRVIEASYSRLSDSDQQDLRDKCGPVRFGGFDGNNESSHRSVANAMIEWMNKYQEFKERDLNTHFPVLDGYRKMLSVFRELGRGDRGLLTRTGLEGLLEFSPPHLATSPPE